MWLTEPPFQARECCAAPSELLNLATRHKEAPTRQEMSLSFSGLWGPLFVAAEVWQKVLNMSEFVSANKSRTDRTSGIWTYNAP